MILLISLCDVYITFHCSQRLKCNQSNSLKQNKQTSNILKLVGLGGNYKELRALYSPFWAEVRSLSLTAKCQKAESTRLANKHKVVNRRMEARADHYLEVIKWHIDGFAIILSFGKKFLADCQLVASELPLNITERQTSFHTIWRHHKGLSTQVGKCTVQKLALCKYKDSYWCKILI